jgi:hypothetical protein
MKTIGFDPGGTTGVAIFDDDTDGFSWERDQVVGEDHHETLWNYLLKEMPDVIVCERFQIRNNVAASTTALEYIGVIKCFAQLSNTTLIMQTPSQAKGFWNDAKLRRCQLYLPSSGHAMDATRHVLYYLMQVGQIPREYLEAQR